MDFLVQGTIYPDVIESGLGKSAVIKSHHNVGGLPDYVDFKEIIEPLRLLFKDEVAAAGLELGIPEYLVFRQPFPGPGLGVRIIGEVTADKVRIVQDADAIYREEIAKAGVRQGAGTVFCGPHQHAFRRCHGRRAHLRLCRGAASGDHLRFHDRGSGGDSLGGAVTGDEPDCQ